MPDLSPRERLIQRLLRLPADELPYFEQLLDNLECGDASPLSFAAEPLSISLPGKLICPQPIAVQSGSAAKKGGDASPHSQCEPHSTTSWPRAPLHRLSEHGTYIVTAGTLHKQHLFHGDDRLDLLHDQLLKTADDFGWQLEAWAVFPNHYHFVAHSNADAGGLDAMLKHLHGETSTELNQLDRQPGRQVWYNFWDTKLTYEKSYLARLNYVHQNAVRHGRAKVANQYRWCSAAWFARTASRAQIQTIYGFKIDRIKVVDDF